MTVAEAIKFLQQVSEQDAPLFFDCPECGKTNLIHEVEQAVVIRTKTQDGRCSGKSK